MLLILVALPVGIQLPEFDAGELVVSSENAIDAIATVEVAETPMTHEPQIQVIPARFKVGLNKGLDELLELPLEVESLPPPPPPHDASKTSVTVHKHFFIYLACGLFSTL